MNSLFGSLDQLVVGFASLVMLCYTFVALNNCDKHTPFLIRIRLVVYLPASVGLLINSMEGVQVNWLYASVIFASTIHLVFDRRKQQVKPPIVLYTAKR